MNRKSPTPTPIASGRARGWTAGLLVLAGLGLSACWERPPMEAEQIGFRGTAMEQVTNPRLTGPLADAQVVPQPPYELGEIPFDAPRARDVYENVQVLGDISADEFNYLMLAITEWIAPEEYRNDPETAGGCAYCHNVANMASDEVYTKGVARRMIQMTQSINTRWASHVQATGVTCWTCHRGQGVPAYNWHADASYDGMQATIGAKHGQNTPGEANVYTSLTRDPFSSYILGDQDIRVISADYLPDAGEIGDERPTIRNTEDTYSLMMHMSDGLGVNCTYCHNSRSFADWSTSPTARATAWHGIRMARDVNATYIQPLTADFPAVGIDGDARLGPLGDALKANCATCHQGLAKPLGGVSMIADYPALRLAEAPRSAPPPARPPVVEPPPAPADPAAPASDAANPPPPETPVDPAAPDPVR